MKTINELLAHIDKITKSAKSGHAHDKAVKEKLAHKSDDEAVRFPPHLRAHSHAPPALAVG